MKITDALTLDASGLTLTRDGYLVGDARVSRAGNVQQYLGREIGLTGADASRVIGVYRDPDVVFAEDAMASLAGRPVTRNHPAEGVTADNWKDLTVGQMGQVIKRDGEHVVAPMAIMDAKAVREVQNGARSLSAGYTVEIVKDAGVSPDGQPYEYRQAGALRFNHVAYLPDNNPRAGNTRIGDDRAKAPSPKQTGDRPMTDNLRKVVIDGISIETTDQGAEALTKLQKQLTDADAAKAKADADHAAALAAKDADLAKKDAELDALKGKVLDASALDAAVQARGDLIVKAKAICADVKTDGVADADIRKAVVIAKRGEKVKDQSQAYFDAAFDILADDVAGLDVQRSALSGLTSVKTDDSALADAQAAYVDRLTRKQKEA